MLQLVGYYALAHNHQLAIFIFIAQTNTASKQTAKQPHKHNGDPPFLIVETYPNKQTETID